MPSLIPELDRVSELADEVERAHTVARAEAMETSRLLKKEQHSVVRDRVTERYLSALSSTRLREPT